jgi:predicted nucleic acid-binding protein
VKFWDTSALVPLIVQEATTQQMLALLARDSDVMVSVLTPVEIRSALARRHREAPNDAALEESRSLLGELSRYWNEVPIHREIIEVASDLLFRQALRAADALQLATAIRAGREQPFVTLDETLARAARAEGLEVET